MTAQLRLHYAPDNASLVIRLALEELRLPFQTILVDRAKQTQKTPAYLKLNPNGLIPVLETEDGPLFETAAILLWLVDRFEGLGPTVRNPARGRFLKWLFFVSNTLHPAMRMTFYPDSYAGSDVQAQSTLRKISTTERLRFVDMLEAEAADPNGSFAREEPNVLDLYVAAAMRWMQLYPREIVAGEFKTSNWPSIHAMALRLEMRPSVHALCKAEGMRQAPFTSPDYPDPPEGNPTAT